MLDPLIEPVLPREKPRLRVLVHNLFRATIPRYRRNEPALVPELPVVVPESSPEHLLHFDHPPVMEFGLDASAHRGEGYDETEGGKEHYEEHYPPRQGTHAGLVTGHTRTVGRGTTACFTVHVIGTSLHGKGQAGKEERDQEDKVDVHIWFRSIIFI